MTLRETIAAGYRTGKGKPASVTWDEAGVPRDQWKRPVIVRPDGTARGYTRISSLAKALDDGIGLGAWKVGMAAVGIVQRPEWVERVQQMGLDPTPWDTHKAELQQICAQAQELAGSKVKADLGTELHHWTRVYDRTKDINLVPVEHRRDLDAYLWATPHLSMLSAETFVVVDEIEAAGTFDRLCADTHGLPKIVEIKTGKWDRDYPMAVEMQTAMYAHGEIYDLTTGERTPVGADLSEGLLIHMPSGSGTCDVYELDIERGWRNVLLAIAIRQARKDCRALSPIVHEQVA